MIKGFYKEPYDTLADAKYLADPMTIWVGTDAVCGKANGYIVYNHDGIDNIRKVVGEKYKVYALRENDDLDGNPATLEIGEVVVNFFGYFVTETDLDWAFANREFQPVYDWDYDPWGITAPSGR